ncbi:hypothetical protein [Arthrobacter sp. UYEF21]|uniref:hypothetical protein n=1 Tax=Arthrobacter sp. UYEF21 TaxID=1756364 RepID=UPI003399787F
MHKSAGLHPVLFSRQRWKVPAVLLMGIAMKMLVIYVLFYTPLIHAHPVMAAISTTRNVPLWWSVRRTAELGR